MKTYYKTIYTILAAVLISSASSAQDTYSKALEAVSKGHTYSSIDKLTELTFDESDKVRLGKIYAILSIAYTLQDEKPKEKYENLFLIIPEDMQDSIGATFVKFFTGQISSAKLKKAVSMSGNNWQAASIIARYLVLLRDNPDIESLKSLAAEYKKKCSSLEKDDWGKVWYSRIDKWQDWINKKNKSKYGLEKLIITDRKIEEKLKIDIEQVTLNQYADLREKYKNRPKEASLDFDKNKVIKYIESLPENLQKLEKARFNTVASIKTYIVRVLERSPFPNGIKTKRRNIRGTITMANENYLVYKKSTKSRKTQRLYWKEVSPEQYSDMMEYYAKRRSNVTGAGGKTQAQFKKDAANDYLGAAILCDWFGNYESALKYAKAAVKHNPDLRKTVSKMILE
jgi:hypothetical protein